MGKEAEMIEQQMVSSDRLLVSPPLTRLSPSTLVVTNLLSSQPLLRWRRQPRPRTTVLSGQTITGQADILGLLGVILPLLGRFLESPHGHWEVKGPNPQLLLQIYREGERGRAD